MACATGSTRSCSPSTLAVPGRVSHRPPRRPRHRSCHCAHPGREACGGDLLESTPYGWVEIPREDTRRQAVDALARLAELRQATGDPEGALVALEQAIAADPVAEELYRRLMRPLTEAGSAGATVDSRNRPGLLATH